MSEMTEIPGSKSEKHPDSSKARKQPRTEWRSDSAKSYGNGNKEVYDVFY